MVRPGWFSRRRQQHRRVPCWRRQQFGQHYQQLSRLVSRSPDRGVGRSTCSISTLDRKWNMKTSAPQQEPAPKDVDVGRKVIKKVFPTSRVWRPVSMQQKGELTHRNLLDNVYSIVELQVPLPRCAVLCCADFCGLEVTRRWGRGAPCHADQTEDHTHSHCGPILISGLLRKEAEPLETVRRYNVPPCR